MSKILITGASGLLGTEFCRQLKEAGHEVWAIDNHSRSTTIPPCDKWIKMDLLNSDSFTGYADLPTDFDYIYHYGAINGTTNFYKMPNKVLTNNFISDINIFEFARKQTNLKRLVYASSSEIVADDFNVYGENSKQGHFLGDQINKIKNGVFSVIGPQETRSFCHVSDAIRASIYVAENCNREVINVGNDREISIGEAVQVIARVMGHTNPIFEHLPSMPGSVANRRPDISKLRSIMPDYAPMSFEEGIRQILS